MKRIINGKEYDADTATKIAEIDYDYTFEELFKSPTGKFFLHVTYKGIGNEYIVPLTDKDTYEWAEGSEDEDTYKAVFEAFSEKSKASAAIAHQFAQMKPERKVDYLDRVINSGIAMTEKRKQELIKMKQDINAQMEIDKVNAHISSQASAGRN